MSSVLSNNSTTSGFVDLATYDELEKYLYGGENAVTYFLRKVRKATWFTMVPVSLSQDGGQPDFNRQWSAAVSRSGDYMIQNWLRVKIPEVQLAAGIDPTLFGIRWTRNLMHNLVQECAITFNDLTEARFDSWHLDFWAAFTVPAGKRVGYDNMIGNIPALTDRYSLGLLDGILPETTLNLPLILTHT